MSKIPRALSFAMAPLLIHVSYLSVCIDEYVAFFSPSLSILFIFFFFAVFFSIQLDFSAPTLNASPSLSLCVRVYVCASISISLLSLSSLLSHNKCVNFINDQLFLSLYRWIHRHSLAIHRFPICPRRILLAIFFLCVYVCCVLFIRFAASHSKKKLSSEMDSRARSRMPVCVVILLLMFHGRMYNISFGKRKKNERERILSVWVVQSFHGIHNKFYVICNVYLRMLAVSIIINADNNSLCQKMVMILKCY